MSTYQSSVERRQPSKEEAERAFDIVGRFQYCNEEKDRVELRGSPTMLALEISKALRDVAVAAAAPAEAEKRRAPVEFKLAQAKDLLEMFGGDETLITVEPYEGKLVAYASEYPDEGSIVLGEMSPPAPEPSAESEAAFEAWYAKDEWSGDCEKSAREEAFMAGWLAARLGGAK